MASMAILSLTVPQDLLLNRPLMAAYFVPMVVAGLILGANAMLFFGILTVVILIIIGIYTNTWANWTSVGTIVIAAATALLWTMVHKLEDLLTYARGQTKAAQLAHVETEKSEARFRTIFEAAPVGMVLVGVDGRI